jgi:uncharacterized protein YidB (DUF937 family)
MSFLSGIVGNLMGQTEGGASPVHDVLAGLVGGGQQGDISANQGGLTGLIENFQQAGLGDMIQSWIGNGPNQSVLPEQIRSAMGNEWVQRMASASGLVPEDLLNHLSQHLPNAVDAMTPDSRID